MIAITEVMETDDVVIVTNGGKIIRQHASEIRVAGRNTQGVRLIRLEAKDLVSDVSAVPSEEDEVVEAQAARVESAAAPAPVPKASGPKPPAEAPTPQAKPAKLDAKTAEKPGNRERQPAQPARKAAGKRKGKRR
jgi:DNA gyrase subunit A